MSFDLKITSGDLQIGADGGLKIVENSEKLTQEILKIISTRIGSNPFFPWYGCPIDQSLIGTAYEEDFIPNIASSQLRTSLETLANLQKDQLKSPQVVTPQEQIAAIQNVSVTRNSIDPRFYQILVTVLSKAFLRVQTSLSISL